MSIVRLSSAVLLALALASVSACTTFATALSEFDSVSGHEQGGVEPDAVEYQDQPRRMPWALRQIEGLGVDAVFANLFGIEPEPSAVENPAGFARERLRILIDKCGDDLERCAEVAARVLWVGDLDAYPLNRIEALKGMGRVLDLQGMNPLEALEPDPERTTQAQLAAWLETIEAAWPGGRSDERSEELREQYSAALAAIAEWPLPAASDQRALIRAMARGYALERDPQLREETAQALRRSMFHGLSGGLLRGLESQSGDVREAAIRNLHRLGGPPAVPFVLSRIAKPAAVAADPRERYDESPYVRRSLLRICGQLNEEQARATWNDGPAAVEFLYETISNDPEEGLQLIALEALAHCLGRPVSFEREWAKQWWVDYVTRRGGRT